MPGPLPRLLRLQGSITHFSQPPHHEDSSDEDGEGQKRAAPDTAGPSHQGEAKIRKKK
jgi:hypothetical protein